MAKPLPQGFRRKKNGSIEYRFMIGEERFSVSASTVKECREKERKKRDAVAAGQYVRNAKITVQQYFDEWMKGRAGTVSESTMHTQQIEFQPVLRIIGGETVASLERRQIIALQGELQKNYSTRGVNYRITMLKTLLKSAVLDEVIPKNPCEGIKPLQRTEPPATETFHRALTLEEQKAFFDAAADQWLYELFLFLIQTGVRIGEALALHWSDIDYKKGMIHIRRTQISTKDGPKEASRTKSKAGMRDIPITEEIRETLRRQRQKVKEYYGDKVAPIDGNVFVSLFGMNCLRTQSVSSSVGRISRKAGIEHIGAHALRDTFATRALEAGMNPQTLKTILGHESYSMTMDLYAHVLPNTKQEEMNRVKIII